jgi:hypothetical protein
MQWTPRNDRKCARSKVIRGQRDQKTKWPGTKWPGWQSDQEHSDRGTKWLGTKWPGKKSAADKVTRGQCYQERKWPGDKVTRGQNDRELSDLLSDSNIFSVLPKTLKKKTNGRTTLWTSCTVYKIICLKRVAQMKHIVSWPDIQRRVRTGREVVPANGQGDRKHDQARPNQWVIGIDSTKVLNLVD